MGLWTSILRVPTPILTALILLFMVIGAYTINFSVFDMFVMIGFGLLGLALRHLDIPLAPMVLTLVLGPADGTLAARIPGNLPGRLRRLRPAAPSPPC